MYNIHLRKEKFNDSISEISISDEEFLKIKNILFSDRPTMVEIGDMIIKTSLIEKVEKINEPSYEKIGEKYQLREASDELKEIDWNRQRKKIEEIGEDLKNKGIIKSL